MNQRLSWRFLLAIISVTGLLLVFLFQRIDVAGILGVDDNFGKFVFNRTIRFLINDAFAIILIYAIFCERKYVLFAVWVQVFGTVFVLMPYFILKFYYPAYNGPLVSFLHRLILNPTLLLLLIPAFYYQKKYS